MQEVLGTVREEVLATTKLPMAIDFLLAELRHAGILGSAMARLDHYFTPFQVFVVQESEDERRRFDLRIGLEVLRREAEYRAESPTPQGLFLYQFEAISRNRLGLRSRARGGGPRSWRSTATWRDWIRTVRRQIGMVDLADLIYVHSEYYHAAGRDVVPVGPERTRCVEAVTSGLGSVGAEDGPARPARDSTAIVLFGEREGRIALANRRKDPLYLFASLHRQLGYPEVPRPKSRRHRSAAAAADRAQTGAIRSAAQARRRRTAGRNRPDAVLPASRSAAARRVGLRRASGKKGSISIPAAEKSRKNRPNSRFNRAARMW